MFHTPPNDVGNPKSSSEHNVANHPSNSCGQCNLEDTKEMVQCDKCNIWYHFTCAGVTDSIENHDWMCFRCIGETANDKSVSVHLLNKTKAMSICSASSSRQKLLKLELQRLEEEKALESRFLNRKFEILAMSEEGAESICNEPISRTREWVSNLQAYSQIKNKNSPCNSHTCFDDKREQQKKQFEKKPLEEDVIELTKNQLSARKALSTDLPVFSGKPEEWPLFISSFVESTKLCGYSDSENLLRLQKCLKGKAFDAVSCHLLMPKNVSEVIRTLKMMFGRPEIIINALLEKIRSEVPLKADRLDGLVSYAISVRNLCSTLEASGLESHKNNPLLLQELVDKLPAQSKINWAMFIANRDADILLFAKWLFDMAEAVAKVSPTVISYKTYGIVHEHEVEQPKQIEQSCVICYKNHFVDKCTKFSEMKLSERWDKVRQFKLCRLCLQKHGFYRCIDAKCPVDNCEARHHKLLHKYKENPVVTTHSISSFSEKTFFKIVPIILYNKYTSVKTFAFLDDGSNVTLIQKDICDQLGLEGNINNLCLKWTSEASRVEKNSMQVNVLISGCNENSKKYELLNVRSVENLSLPLQSITKQDLETYKHLKNIPLSTYNNVSPKILIGLNNGHVCNSLKMVEGAINEPCASKTRLGWVMHGGSDSTLEKTIGYHKIELCNCDCEMEKLNNIVTEYMSLENAGRKYEIVSPEEKRGKFLLQTTTKRIGERFETGLLWKEDTVEVPNSYLMALKRLQCLEKKSNPEQILTITQQINTLVEKGYARKLSENEVNISKGITWYLPIFTVISPNKPGKIRLVWDAAAKVKGVSLNSMLLKGPDLTTSLLSTLYGFRLRKIAICADIKEMFHQVLIRKEDQNAQRFIWRNGENKQKPDVYVMKVMTFGAACSPSSAQYIKNTNALEFRDQFPRAVDSIINHHYVDDLLDCADTVDEAIKLSKQVAFIHSKGGFFIRNWKSNSKVVMKSLGEIEEQNKVVIEPNMIEMSTEKILGMWWSTEDDNFTFSLKLTRINKDVLSGSKRPTKTDVLRTLMSIFDPFGFLSAYVVYLKILLQEIWRTTEGWTDEVNDDIFNKWIIWIKILPNIESVKIPRWFSIQPGCSVQLHVFVDASELAYAAVAYFRISSEDGVQVSFVGAKVKVAPKQPVSIPRMELMAAVLGVRLANVICEVPNVQIESRTFWSDSNTVLCWLRADPRNYKQFVMYRIGEILDCSNLSEWKYIDTKDNVADDATKWKKRFEFNMKSRWFEGPPFLKNNESYWPVNKLKVSKISEDLRPHIVMAHRKLKIKLNKSKNREYLLSDVSKLHSMAETIIYRKMQQEFFEDEYAILSNNIGNISKSSVLYKCSPYVDNNQIIRMNGRIGLITVVPENSRCPIILPRNHYCTSLLIQHFHEKFHHIHHDTCLNELRQYFYIPKLRAELKKVRRNCQQCKNSNASPVIPEMSILPKARLSAFVRTFSFVGIDYFGPLYVKVARHQEKRWGVLFTCLTVRAIHIEVAHDMTTDSCIMAIQNFVARRGTPIEIYCDNGTNFKGAKTELENALKNVDFKILEVRFTTSSTSWHFNPPAAPHMGGSWERLVQSVKKVLHQIMPNFIFKDDTLYNGLLECERVVNSRPLTYVDLDSTTDEALTPNHFLLGSSNGDKPIGKFSADDTVLRKNWRKMQYFADIFWKRWIHEYLPTLTKRTKWFEKCSPLKVGDIVIIVDPNLPRNNWPKGIVQSVCKATDGNVRSADIFSKGGILKRPVAKLAKLDVRRSQTSQNFIG